MTLVCGSCDERWSVPKTKISRKVWWCPYCGRFVEIQRPLREGE